MNDFEGFLSERVLTGQETGKRLPPEHLEKLRDRWETELSGARYMRWFNTLSTDEMSIVLGWEAELAKEEET